MTENGVEPKIISILPPKVPEPPKHPELRPGHIWSPKESKEIFQHLRPRVALIKLKHDKKYIRNLLPRVISEEEETMTELLDRASNIMDSYIMELGGGVSAILEADGSSTVLPPNYKDLIEARRKKTMRWAEESDWVPPRMGYSRKLNIANVVKFGPSVKTICKVKLSRMSNEDVK